jgi:Mg2+/citrate symporter
MMFASGKLFSRIIFCFFNDFGLFKKIVQKFVYNALNTAVHLDAG